MRLLTGQLLQEYLDNPAKMDAKVRSELALPDNCYFTVSVWPAMGHVQIGFRLPRAVNLLKNFKLDEKAQKSRS